MNDKGHFYISLIKSLIRIVGCVVLVAAYGIDNAIGIFGFVIGVAELLGIAEELFDKR